MLNHAKVTNPSLPGVPNEILPFFHKQQAMTLLVAHGCFASLLVTLIVRKGDAFHWIRKFINSERELNCSAEGVGMVLEYKIVRTNLFHLSSVIFIKKVLVRCLMSDLTMKCVTGIRANEIFLHFHFAAPLLERIQTFLEWTLKNAAVLMRYILERNRASVAGWLLWDSWNDLHENIFIFGERSSGQRASTYCDTHYGGSLSSTVLILWRVTHPFSAGQNRRRTESTSVFVIRGKGDRNISGQSH